MLYLQYQLSYYHPEKVPDMELMYSIDIKKQIQKKDNVIRLVSQYHFKLSKYMSQWRAFLRNSFLHFMNNILKDSKLSAFLMSQSTERTYKETDIKLFQSNAFLMGLVCIMIGLLRMNQMARFPRAFFNKIYLLGRIPFNTLNS